MALSESRMRLLNNKLRLINLGLFITFLICYLEWAGGNSGFVFQLELTIFSKDNKSNSFTHPFVLVPLLGQILLFIAIFFPNKKLTLAALLLLSLLVLMILLVGCLSLKPKVIASTLPFICVAIYFFVNYKKMPS